MRAWAGLEFTDFLNLFFFNREEGIGGVLKALQGRGLLQSLAEPNLIAYNGEEASFLAGGEIPIPVVQGLTGQVSVIYKEFGIRLTFRPTIAGDVIRLKLRPEVSSLDFNNGIILSGFRIPALNYTPCRDRRRAARRPVVRDCRPDEQHLADRSAGGADPEQAADHRLPVQEQGRARGADRADGARHAAAGARRSIPTRCRRCRPTRGSSSTRLATRDGRNHRRWRTGPRAVPRPRRRTRPERCASRRSKGRDQGSGSGSGSGMRTEVQPCATCTNGRSTSAEPC